MCQITLMPTTTTQNTTKPLKIHYYGNYAKLSYSFLFEYKEGEHKKKATSTYLLPVQSACQGFSDIETNPYATLRLLAKAFEAQNNHEDNNDDDDNIKNLTVTLHNITQQQHDKKNGDSLYYNVELAIKWDSPPMIRDMVVYHTIPCVPTGSA